MFRRVFAPALVFAGITAACGLAGTPGQGAAGAPEQAIVEPGQLPEADKKVIVALGDSLTAGLGLATTQAFPYLLQELFRAEGYHEVEVANEGVSGDTTAGGLRRVQSLLAGNVKIAVVALGGNDALRGLPIAQTRENLAAIITQLLGADVRVLLAGMEGPTNLGEDYRASFRAVFTGLAKEYGREITFVPFLLEGVAGNPAYNQSDGMHPNEQGARMIADLLYPRLRDMVDQLPDPAIFKAPR